MPTRIIPIFLASLFLAAFQSTAQDPGTANAAPDPRELLRNSMAFLSTAPAYTVDVTMDFQLVRANGERNQNSLKSSLAIAGTDRAVFRVVLDDGTMELFYAPDSKYIFLSNRNQYVVGDDFGNRRKALALMPGGPFRASQILLSDFLHQNEMLLDPANEVTLISAGTDADATCQIRVSSSGVVNDFWIARGDSPLLQRFTMDLTAMITPTNPDISDVRIGYTFANWNLSPTLEEDYFTFHIPEGAVEFKPMEQPKDPLEGQPAPDVELKLLGKEDTFSLASHKGKDVIILDFWASWCGPCRIGLPIVTEVAGRFKEKNVVLYAVNVGEDPRRAQAFVEQTGLAATVALDPQGFAQRAYNARSIPKTVIIGRDGIVHQVHAGVTPSFREDLTETLDELTK